MNNKNSDMVLGTFFIVFGIMLAGDKLNVWDCKFILKGWWTLLIIIPSIIDMSKNRVCGGNLLGVIIGSMFLAASKGIITHRIIWKLLFPIILIVMGIDILFLKKTKDEKEEVDNF